MEVFITKCSCITLSIFISKYFEMLCNSDAHISIRIFQYCLQFHCSGSLLTYLFPDSNGTRQVFAVDLPKPLSAEHSSSSEQSDVIIGELKRAFVFTSPFFDPQINLFYFSNTFLFTTFFCHKMLYIFL